MSAALPTGEELRVKCVVVGEGSPCTGVWPCPKIYRLQFCRTVREVWCWGGFPAPGLARDPRVRKSPWG